MKFLLPLVALVCASYGACPHEDPLLQKWSTFAWPDPPTEGEDLTIDANILLDVNTPSLGNLNIAGGKLVWSPDHEVSLTANMVRVGDGSSLVIGSEDCPYENVTSITLTGTRSDDPDVADPVFGEKYLGVCAGGSLEIHGEQDRLAWTKLNKTLVKTAPLYDVDTVGRLSRYGLYLWEFSPSGELRSMYPRIDNVYEIDDAVAVLQSDSVIVMGKFTGLREDKFVEELPGISSHVSVYLLNEAPCKLSNLGNSSDAWAMVVDLSNKDGAQQSIALSSESEDLEDGLETDRLRLELGSAVFEVQDFTDPLDISGVPDKIDVQVFIADHWTHLNVELADDASSWRPGDKVVIASTDFDHKQAEVFEITEVRGNVVDLAGECLYTHFGEIWEGIDMRAEVGLLTRNIKISGDIEEGKEPCLGELNECIAGEGEGDSDFDTFGGHIMALEGYVSYNIRGAELFHMGQAEVIGRYPIHFHMAINTTRDGVPSVMADNVIRDSFSRCYTVHGSHGVVLRNNVAYNHIGHCFFLEDGGERDTVIDGNLGLGTKRGALTPSDTRPTTFWITSPLTTVVNNAAAGADTSSGNGFWFLYPDEPVGASAGLGFFRNREAKRTPITKFDNNVAHSNGDNGLAVNRRLGENHEIIGCSTYDPLVNPLNRRSDITPVILSDFTAYKNRDKNVISRAKTTLISGFKLADAKVGIEFNRNMLGGYQRVIDSVIAGETPNVGNDLRARTSDGKWVTLDRSYPDSRNVNVTYSGVNLNAEGPSRIEGVKFLNFKTTETRTGAGIRFAHRHRHQNGASTWAKDVTFNYMDSEGCFVYQPNSIDRNAQSIAIRDLDGSLTGQPGASIIKDDAYYQTTSDNCALKTDWNLNICESRFANIYTSSSSDNDNKIFLATDGNVQKRVYSRPAFTLAVTKETAASRTVDPAWNISQVPVINFNGTVKGSTLRIHPSGLDTGDSLMLGVCLPMGVVNALAAEEVTMSRLFETEGTMEVASTLEDLMENHENGVYLDVSSGVLYRRFKEDQVRGDDDLGDCIGDTSDFSDCPYLFFFLSRGDDLGMDRSDFNCLDRL